MAPSFIMEDARPGKQKRFRKAASPLQNPLPSCSSNKTVLYVFWLLETARPRLPDHHAMISGFPW